MARTKGSKNKAKATTSDVVPPESQVPPVLRQQDALEGDGTPGVGRVKIPEVETAAIRFRNARDERMTLTEEECAAKTALVLVMKKHELTRYQYDDQLVEFKAGKENVKVKTVDNPIEQQQEEAA